MKKVVISVLATVLLGACDPGEPGEGEGAGMDTGRVSVDAADTGVPVSVETLAESDVATDSVAYPLEDDGTGWGTSSADIGVGAADTAGTDDDTESASASSFGTVADEAKVPDTGGVSWDSESVETGTNDTVVSSMDTTEIDDTAGDTFGLESDTEPAACDPTLVINEVDYDVPGRDTTEFIEIYNPTTCDMPLDGIVLILANGSDMTEYRRIALDASLSILAADSYLLVHGVEFDNVNNVPAIPIGNASGFIQNGPDGMAIFDEVAGAMLDAFCYEAPLTQVVFTDAADVYNLAEGEIDANLLDTGDESVSLGRIPNGVDTNVAAVDWARTIATPGAANTRLPESLLPE